MFKLNKKTRLWWSCLSCLSLSILPVANRPVFSAERVYFSYSILERSIPVSALETFASTGRIPSELQAYARYLDSNQLQQLRVGLQESIDLKPVTIAQFLYTPIGEALLQRLTRVVGIKSGVPSFHALRGALILAAADPEGLTVLSLLRHFPAQGIQLNISEGLNIWSEVQQLVQQTEAAVTAIQQQPPPEPTLTALSGLNQLGDPQFSGPYSWQKTTLELMDQTQRRLDLSGSARKFLADIYLPVLGQPQGRPVIVISHGLNSDRTSYAYLARHLASYGFVVAVPEHPGSNTEQLVALASGRAGAVAQPKEFIDRPLDVSYLLDELSQLSQTNPTFQGRLNLDQVGVVGQSYGGYTALVLAGAEINFAELEQVCPTGLADTLNLSLFLQCQALELPRRPYQLSDPRVKGVIAVNPLTSVVLGAPGLSQIKIPVMVIASSADTIAPALPEQIQPFTWLTAPNKYLVVMAGATHLSTISASSLESEVLPTVPGTIGPTPEVARNYLEALSVAFLQTHVGNQPAYGAYLSPIYINVLSRPPLPLSVVEQFTLPLAINSSRN